MAGQSALRRWTRFLTCFDYIDAAIEAADPSVSRDEFRRLRVQIVEMLCAAGEEKVEGISMILDGVMAESLVTLQSVPAHVIPKILASSADLANAVGALRSHASERVRGLARGIIREWKGSVEGDIARMNAAMAKLDALSQPSEGMVASHVSDGRNDNNVPSNSAKKKDQPNIQEDKPCPKKMTRESAQTKIATAAGTSRETTAHKKAPMKMSMMSKERTASASTASSHVTNGQSDNLPLKHPAKIHQGNRPPTKKMADHVKVAVVWSPEERMEATKRKLHEGYQEAANAKRQRKMIQVAKAPKMLPEEHKQSKTHATVSVRERSRERFGTVRRSLLSSFDRV